MILNIDPFKSLLLSVVAAISGEYYTALMNVAQAGNEIVFQWVVRIIAALAGLVSIINGIIKIIEYFRKRKNGSKE